MSEPTPDDIDVARTLAELLGCRMIQYNTDTRSLWVLRPGDSVLSEFKPADDLNAMAAVEAALDQRGLVRAYLNELIRDAAAEPMKGGDIEGYTLGIVRAAATAPAAVRALAAYRVLEANQ